VATPPNALFLSGHMRIGDMLRAVVLRLNLMGVAVVTCGQLLVDDWVVWPVMF